MLNNGTRRWLKRPGAHDDFAVQPAGTLHFNPDDLRQNSKKPDEMSYYDMQEFIENQRRAGQDVSRWEVLLLQDLVPVCVGDCGPLWRPLLLHPPQRGVGVQPVSLLICFVYRYS
jgi:hypothetical protein